MLSQEKLSRLQELAQKQKSGGLSPAELVEQMALREEYRMTFRSRLATELESIGMRQRGPQGCDCGCSLKH